MEEEDDPEWQALVAVVRGRHVLRDAVRGLALRHSLDEAAAIRRLLWIAVVQEVGLIEAALLVAAGQDDTPPS